MRPLYTARVDDEGPGTGRQNKGSGDGRRGWRRGMGAGSSIADGYVLAEGVNSWLGIKAEFVFEREHRSVQCARSASAE